MSHKDDYFDGDTYDLLLYKIAQRDKVIEVCKEEFNSYESRGYCNSQQALAAIEQLKSGGGV